MTRSDTSVRPPDFAEGTTNRSDGNIVWVSQSNFWERIRQDTHNRHGL